MVDLNINDGKWTGSVTWRRGLSVSQAIKDYDSGEVIVTRGSIQSILVNGNEANSSQEVADGDTISITLG